MHLQQLSKIHIAQRLRSPRRDLSGCCAIWCLLHDLHMAGNARYPSVPLQCQQQGSTAVC